ASGSFKSAAVTASNGLVMERLRFYDLSSKPIHFDTQTDALTMVFIQGSSNGFGGELQSIFA
ncbi:hypothetical protein QWY20_06960, partial [Alkalimonas sp. MEB108]